MARDLVCFAHGKESGPWGVKITALAAVARALGYEVMSPDYSHTHDPLARVEQLLRLSPHASGKLVLAGSSMGGYVSLAASAKLRPDGLFLMAPAIYFPGYSTATGWARRTEIVHGWQDEIIPADHSIRYAREHAAHLHLLPSNHSLVSELAALEALFTHFLRQVLALPARIESV